jgi:hypothetical protein
MLPTAWGLQGNQATENGGEWYRFGSYHPSIVQFCFADGSVRPVKVQATDSALLAASGIRDQVFVSDPNITSN